jgi:hypothetical protein
MFKLEVGSYSFVNLIVFVCNKMHFADLSWSLKLCTFVILYLIRYGFGFFVDFTIFFSRICVRDWSSSL